MKKTALVLAMLFALSMGSCQGIFAPAPASAPAPTINSAGTADALFNTSVAQTLTAQPTLPPAVTTEAPTLPAASPVLPASETPTAAAVENSTTPAGPTPTFVATGTSDVPTATGLSANPSLAGTPTLVPSPVSTIWTLAVRKYGTLPPEVPFSHITLVNKAKAEAYISMHVDMPRGRNTVIEYPVKGSIKIEAPVGPYTYVAWVGGNKMVGTFRLHANDDLTITLYKDRVAIK